MKHLNAYLVTRYFEDDQYFEEWEPTFGSTIIPDGATNGEVLAMMDGIRHRFGWRGQKRHIEPGLTDFEFAEQDAPAALFRIALPRKTRTGGC